MTATWPASLPQYVLRDPFQGAPHWPRYAFDAEAGLPIEMAMTTVKLEKLQCGVIVTGTQFDTLEDFVFDTLAMGSLPFDGPHPRTQATVQLKFINNPAPYSYRNVKADKWTVTFALMALTTGT